MLALRDLIYLSTPTSRWGGLYVNIIYVGRKPKTGLNPHEDRLRYRKLSSQCLIFSSYIMRIKLIQSCSQAIRLNFACIRDLL